MIIAIDGTSGSGKTTISKQLSKELGFAYITTGTFYRALAYVASTKNINPNDEQKVQKMLQTTQIQADFSGSSAKICVNGENISMHLYNPKVSADSSVISTLPCVREYVSRLQKDSANHYPNIIMEGRDIGSVVFPNAELKVYVDCDIKTRALRRKLQSEKNGDVVDLEQTEKDLIQRDYNDTHRKISPLVRLPDAFFVDTTNNDVDVCVKMIIEQVNKIQQNKN